MDTQTQNNIRGMRLPDSPSDELGDDLIFDPVLERKRIVDGTEEYLEELRRDFAKYIVGKDAFPESVSKLSSALREWMLSFDRTSFYDRLAREFDLQGSDRMGLARLAWNIVLQSDWSPSVELFQKYISQASVVPEIAKRFATDFIPKARELSLIADARPNASSPSISRSVLTEQKAVDRVEISLMQALGKFEKLGGQQVTNSKIVIKGQNDPVRPTIFNWLRAYRDELGVGAHDAVTRGQFLFHSLNGKGLSSDERDQVGLLLKSLDENVPLTIDAGRQEVLFNRQSTMNRQQGAARIAVVPPAGGASAVREEKIENGGLTTPKAERPLFTNQDSGNISRAVFEMPHINQQTIGSREQITDNSQQITGSREQGALPHSLGTESLAGRQEIPNTIRQMTDQMPNRPSAFEQAKAIQVANRDARLSIANMNSETVELGKMETPHEEIRSAVAPPRLPIVPQSVAPAPRAISFEPAKIDNFSFGASNQKTFSNSGRTASETNSGRTPQEGERPLPTRTEDFRPNFAPRDDMNVSSLSFSTNHVMPAEKERIREQRSENREQVESRTAVAPLKSGTTVIRDQTVAERPLPIPTPVKKTPTAPVAPSKPPVNRFRITPTGHRDEAASDDAPSPHVVDLRG